MRHAPLPAIVRSVTWRSSFACGAKQKGMASMALEEHNANHAHPERSTAELSFDELAKDVASGTLSRRKALRLLGAALVGSALASIPGVAWAAKGGNRECVRCCKEKFGPGRKRGECISAGARGECPVTCDGNGGGNCLNGTTECPFQFGCQNNEGCFCATTVEGLNTCVQSEFVCEPSEFFCTSSQDCPTGWVCATTCCDLPEQGVCNPPCGTTIPTASSAKQGGMSGH